MDWGSTLAPRRARHDTEEAVYLPTQHNAEGALMFLLGNDYDEDASDEFLVGKAAVKYPSASNSVYRAMITIGKDRRSALLRKWVADYSTKPMTKKTAKNLSLFDSPRYNPGKGEKRMQDSACSDVGWGKTRSKEPLSQKTESPYTMRMPTGDSRARTAESTPTPQSRRVKSCDSDSFVFLETPLASSNVADKQEETGSTISMGDGWGKSPASMVSMLPPYMSTERGWGNGGQARPSSSAVKFGPVSPESSPCFGEVNAASSVYSKGRCGYNDDGESIFIPGRRQSKLTDDNLGWGAESVRSPAPERPENSLEFALLQNHVDCLQDRLDAMSQTLEQTTQSLEEQRMASATTKSAATAATHAQPCSENSIKSLSDLLSLTKALSIPQAASSVDNATRESIHRVEVEMANARCALPNARIRWNATRATGTLAR
ncbi:uncharacterized protein MYCGRDRAFT_90155 [Zymoseptoria tritici IPO323]|uniref:Uncharacterized protein n=1 Tax=Zymoseptoria tritici (strain CBS 115943 / IPO323) TaxID=336722 RepID=F9X0Q8_ZYMTI|nr:uncharacterized protein MYCGRDRAFT_90155 [Zymoseptoria tritici IPO323]EGP91721.1 hypothetical protein MYCGRDRAFT_90155 [Zymoseptoria tritici IPO323]